MKYVACRGFLAFPLVMMVREETAPMVREETAPMVHEETAPVVHEETAPMVHEETAPMPSKRLTPRGRRIVTFTLMKEQIGAVRLIQFPTTKML